MSPSIGKSVFFPKASLRHRNTVVSLNDFMVNFGWLLGIILGLVVPLQYYNLVLCLPSILFLPLWALLVESPMWLLRRNKTKEAIAILQLGKSSLLYFLQFRGSSLK